MSVTVLRVDHVQLAMPAGEEGRARAFYGALLGLEELPKPHSGRGGVWFRRGAVEIHLGVEAAFQPARKAHPALVVLGYDALLQRLAAAGHPPRPDSSLAGVVRCFVDDPFGNRIELIRGDAQPLRPRPAGDGIAVVPIAEAHAAGFHACLDAVAREKRYLAQTEAPPLERLQGFVREGLAKDAAQFVALDGGQVVGWCDVLAAWPQALRHCGTLGMGVLAAYRGRGIGERLLTTTLDKARTQGIRRVTLEVRADNEPAMRLYRRVGFLQEAYLRHALRYDGQYHDAWQMSLVWED